MLEQLFKDNGFANIESRCIDLTFQTPSAEQMLEMMQEAFGVYRAVISDSPETVQATAWTEGLEFFRSIATDNGLETPIEVLVSSAQNPT